VSAAITTSHATAAKSGAASPSFPGLLRGELFKISRMRVVWVMLALLISVIALPYLIFFATASLKDNFATQPDVFLYRIVDANLFTLRVFGGIFLLILTALVFGTEYQLGTIRILLSRGVGRLHLLAAKLLAVMLVALGIFVAVVALDALLDWVLLLKDMGGTAMQQHMTSAFWTDTRIYLLTILVSMGVTILLAMTTTIVGRGLVFGLGLALAWFPADNIGVEFMRLAYRLTGNTFWMNITGTWLGPNLNAMPSVSATTIYGQHALSASFSPLVDVTGAHTLTVALIYAAIFVAVSVVLMWKRDVQE